MLSVFFQGSEPVPSFDPDVQNFFAGVLWTNSRQANALSFLIELLAE